MYYEIPELRGAITICPGTADPITYMRGCPDCGGRGWRNATPFADFNMRFVQCPTCVRSKQHHEAHGTIPEDVAVRMTPNVS